MSEAITRLKTFKCSASSELELQDALEDLWQGLFFVREKILSPKDRVDFLFTDGLAVEVKIGGSSGALLRQLARYATYKPVIQILVVTTRSHQLTQLPQSLNGKPIFKHMIFGGL